MYFKVRHCQAIFIKSCKVNISWQGMALVRYIVFVVENSVLLRSELHNKTYDKHVSIVCA
jgi:hypothetical protein